ncbi:hypothetical protein N7457_004994 [Penicillium paradoxum]|uniref:uncharacterized protein n=1 Tax=Penicillium paradoxum TaxID=176176 RepID=UPI002546F914|nr:uncharacterized protein N7457_004994 [Penicillium paradoxum]KAJ5783220.1 hypothetical protein N7457_004994 [Penicillium paradoxum]
MLPDANFTMQGHRKCATQHVTLTSLVQRARAAVGELRGRRRSGCSRFDSSKLKTAINKLAAAFETCPITVAKRNGS